MTKTFSLHMTDTQLIYLAIIVTVVVSYFIASKRRKARESKKEVTNPDLSIDVTLFGEPFHGGKMNDMDLRDYFAAKALAASVSETQETVPASFWDWVKGILREMLNMTFLEVRYKSIEGAYEQAAKRSYKYADAFITEKARRTQLEIEKGK